MHRAAYYLWRRSYLATQVNYLQPLEMISNINTYEWLKYLPKIGYQINKINTEYQIKAMVLMMEYFITRYMEYRYLNLTYLGKIEADMM